MRIAIIQMTVTADKSANLAHARELLHAAAAGGLDLAVLPEMFCCPYANRCFPLFAEERGGEAWRMLSRTARELGIWLIGGSYPEREGERLYNTSFVFDRTGREVARHRKAHLFDIDVEGGQRFRESDTLSAGDSLTVFDTEFGRLGLCICFDLRFQEFVRRMGEAGALLITAPAAFNMTTGPAHWELLLRQRAVDNQLFMLGAAPARDESAEYVSYANSLVADPWGTVLARAGEGEEILRCEVDLGRCKAVRRQLPVLR